MNTLRSSSHRSASLAMIFDSFVKCAPHQLAIVLLAILILSATGCGGAKETAAGGEDLTNKSAGDVSETAGGTSKSVDATPATDDTKKANPQSNRTFVREDVHTTYFPDRRVYQRREVKLYSDNSLVNHGQYTENWPSGQKSKEGKFADGVQVGPWYEYYENGKVARQSNYVDGKLDGSWSWFDENGKKKADVSYKAGKRVGKWIFYQPDGKVTKTEEYEDGKLINKSAGNAN